MTLPHPTTLQPLTPVMLASIEEQHAPCPVCQGVARIARGCPACGDTGRLPAGVEPMTGQKAKPAVAQLSQSSTERP